MVVKNKIQNISEIILSNTQFKSLTLALVLIAVACVAPFFHYQPITGPIVNATLFLATIYLGYPLKFLPALVPSLIAVTIGTLPTIAAPLIPAIVLSNFILIIIFGKLKEKNYWLAIILASFGKFIFLSIFGWLIVSLLKSNQIIQIAFSMFSWAQLFTALTGGLLAWGIWQKIGKNY